MPIPNVDKWGAQTCRSNKGCQKNQVKSGSVILLLNVPDTNHYQNVTNLIFVIVCFDIQLNIVGETQDEKPTFLKKNSTVRWRLGGCASLNGIESGATYQYPAVYTERCCLESGKHTLVCYNNPHARGWNNAYILINDHRYCDDFISYRSYQKIRVTGMSFKLYFG